jgi:hypothetical protein
MCLKYTDQEIEDMEKKPDILGDDFVIKSDLKFGTSIAIDPPALE